MREASASAWPGESPAGAQWKGVSATEPGDLRVSEKPLHWQKPALPTEPRTFVQSMFLVQ